MLVGTVTCSQNSNLFCVNNHVLTSSVNTFEHALISLLGERSGNQSIYSGIGFPYTPPVDFMQHVKSEESKIASFLNIARILGRANSQKVNG